MLKRTPVTLRAFFTTACCLSGLALLLAPPVYGQGTLFVEGSNVGIGIASPEATLHVSGGPLLLDNLQSLRVKRTTGDQQELFSLDNNDDVVFNRGSIVAGQASHLIFGVGAGHRFEVRSSGNVPLMRLIESSGRVAFGNFMPSHPLEMASGAHVTAGGVWTNASSREFKTGIEPLQPEDALEALDQITPVEFRYLAEPEQGRIGFIAEDLPDLVAERDRRSASAMDLVALLTAVVKEQRTTIARQEQLLGELAGRVSQLENESGN